MKAFWEIVIAIVTYLLIIALHGWLVSLCVSIVFGINFGFMKGVALYLTCRLLFGTIKIEREAD